MNKIIKIDTYRTKISPDPVFPNKTIQSNSNKWILKVWIKQFSTVANVLTPLLEFFSVIKFWWFFIFILSHSTILLALPYILREESLHYFDIATSNQPRFRYNTPISDISDIKFLADASRFDVLIERFQIASSKDFISVCDFNGFLLCVQCWVSKKTRRDPYFHSKNFSENIWQTEITEQSITIDIIIRNSWLWVIILWNIFWLIIVIWWCFIPKLPRFFHLYKVDSKLAYLRNLKESILLGI